MENQYWLLLGGIALLVAAAVAIAVALSKRRPKTDRIGEAGEKAVARILRPWAMLRNYRVINDIYLPLYDTTTQIDHIVIGFFGLIVIETKNLGGEVYGDPKEKEWTHIMGGKRRKIYNPILQNKAHIDCIRHWFSKDGIYNVTIDNLVVFANNSCDLYLSKSDDLIVKRKKLKALLNRSRYEKDRDIDVERIYRCLMSHAVTDPELIARHNEDVEMIAAKRKK